MIRRVQKTVRNTALVWTMLLLTSPVYAGEGDTALFVVRSAASSEPAGQRVTAVGTQIERIFGSVYNMLNTVSVCVAMIGMIVAFVEIGLSRRGRLRETAKGKLVGIAVALILIGGATTFINLFLRLIV